MAQHDPIQDEVDRQIREGTLTEARGRSPFFRGAIASRIRSNIAGTDTEFRTIRNNPELLEHAAQRAGVEGGFRKQEEIVARRERAERIQADAASKRLLAERTGEARLATANAALATARTGVAKGKNLSEAAAEALGLDSRFVGEISPTTARAATARNTSTERLKREDQRIEAARAKEVAAQKRREKQFGLNQVREARLQTDKQVKAILEGTDVSEETQKKISFTISQALSKLQDEEVPPEVVDELFNEALGETFGDRKKAAVLAKQRARERGFFVPE